MATLLTSQVTDVTDAHDRLLCDGFVKLSGRLSADAVKVMQSESQALLAGKPEPWGVYPSFASQGRWGPLLVGEGGRNTNLFDFLGESSWLDDQIDAILGQPELKELLVRVLGEGYGVWYAQIRRAELDSTPLRMHQDIPGEVGLGILLSDIDSLHGTTVFLKGSHRWPRLLNTFPFLSPSRILRFLSAAKGSPGECYLFYNCTWHGGSTALGEPKTAIILTFLPQSMRDSLRKPPTEILKRVPPHVRDSLVGAKLAEIDGNVGPDEIVSEQTSIPLISPWRLAILAAKICDLAVGAYRRVRRLICTDIKSVD